MAKKEPDKLAQDAAAALAAGMSYGKWKALQCNSTAKVEQSVPDGWLVCNYCGKAFKPKTKRKQLYCEPVCQAAASRERCRENYNAYKRAYNARKRAELEG